MEEAQKEQQPEEQAEPKDEDLDPPQLETSGRIASLKRTTRLPVGAVDGQGAPPSRGSGVSRKCHRHDLCSHPSNWGDLVAK